MLESIKKFEGSDVQAFIEERTRYWTSVAMCTQNRLVSDIASSLNKLKERKFSSVGELKDYCEEASRPTTDFVTFSLGRIAVMVSVLEFIDGKPQELDAFQFLSKVSLRRVELESRRQNIPKKTEEQRLELRRKNAAKYGYEINPIGGEEPKEPERFHKLVKRFVNPFAEVPAK